MYCSIHTNKQQVFMGGQQFSNKVPLTVNINSQSMGFYVKQFSRPYFSGSRIKLKENNVLATTHCTYSSCHAVVISLSETKVDESYELRSEGKSLLLQDLGIFKTINESVIKFKLLAISMNVERNPGPEFTKVIWGSFSQGNNPKFGNMAGKQCCAIALYSLAFSMVKDVSYWQRDTLDSILEHGTALYEKLGKDGFLTVEDLPHQVEIFNVPVSVEFEFNSHGLLNREHFNLENMKQMICANSKYDEAKLNTGFLLMLSEVTVSVIIKKQLFSPDTLKLAVLDSHGRDKDGRISSDGMSVLMFFDNVSSFIDYVSETYLDTHNSEYLLPYQVQFVHCSSSVTEETRKRIVRLHRSSSFLLCAKMKRIECRANESKEQRSARLEKQRRSENLKISNETIAERSTRLEQKRNFDNLKRSNEAITERSKRLENMRKFDSSNRSNETIAERSTRLMKKRNFDNVKRSNETIAERSTRLEKKRNFDNLKRSNETIAERSTRLEKKRNFDNVKRSNEAIAERSTRLEKKRNFDNLKRSNETITERSKSLENMRKFDSSKRSNETIAERSTRLMKKRNFDNLKRSNETIAERSTRLMKIRNFDNLKRSNETVIERLERLRKKRKCDNCRRSNETVVTRQLRLSRLRKYQKLAQSRERTKKSRTLVTTMENRRITKKQESVSDKLLKLAKQRKLAKLIQFSKITVQKASQCSDLPIETTEIPESLGTIEEAFRNIDAMGTTSNQTLKRKDSEMFLTRSEEILGTDKCSQSMEVESNLMQNELNMLSMIPFSSVNNALNVNKFLTDIEAGPYYICKSCNRMLYRKSVRKFHRDTYSVDIFTDVPSFDNEQYICNTCHSKLMKGKIPCQAVYNKLQMDQAPPELEELRKLESILGSTKACFPENCCPSQRSTEKSQGGNL